MSDYDLGRLMAIDDDFEDLVDSLEKELQPVIDSLVARYSGQELVDAIKSEVQALVDSLKPDLVGVQQLVDELEVDGRAFVEAWARDHAEALAGGGRLEPPAEHGVGLVGDDELGQLVQELAADGDLQRVVDGLASDEGFRVLVDALEREGRVGLAGGRPDSPASGDPGGGTAGTMPAPLEPE